MDLIIKMEFGSTVYGTRLPTSDTDYKAIYIPEPREIILQKVKPTIVEGTKEDKNSRNGKDDVDTETFSLQQYCKLLTEGQTVSIDMLFTPNACWMETSPIWEEIVANKDKFVHKGINAFIGYARTQANKYGIKGSRVSAMRTVLEYLKQKFPVSKIGDFEADWKVLSVNTEHVSIVYCKGPKGTQEPHLEVCNRKIPFHASVKYALEIFQRIFDEYGARARLAEENNGVDWKALMHAVRVCTQAQELLTTGNITFPNTNRELLLKIRQGLLPYREVAELLENEFTNLEKANSLSTLPEKPDYKFIEELVYQTYLKKVKS